jgi:hypothetical protein
MLKLLFWASVLLLSVYSRTAYSQDIAPPPAASLFDTESRKSVVEMQKLLSGVWVLETDPTQTVTFTKTGAQFKLKTLKVKATSYKLHQDCPCNFDSVPPLADMAGCFTVTTPKVCFAIGAISETELEFRAINPTIGDYYKLVKKQ